MNKYGNVPVVDLRLTAFIVWMRKWHNESLMARATAGNLASRRLVRFFLYMQTFLNSEKSCKGPHWCAVCAMGKVQTASPAGVAPHTKTLAASPRLWSLPGTKLALCWLTSPQISTEKWQVSGTRVITGTRCHSCAYSADNTLVEILMPLMVCLFSPEWTNQTARAGT